MCSSSTTSANGNASMGVIDLARQAATIEGMGFIIQKAFQSGGDVRRQGIRFESLAVVRSLDDCKIVLE